MSNNDQVLVDIFKYHGDPKKVLAFFDVDLTLRDSMCTNTPLVQHQLISDLYRLTEAGIVFASGRSSDSLDKTFVGSYPHSSEHHSAIRMEKNGTIYALAPQLNTMAVAEHSSVLIGDQISVVDCPETVRDNHGQALVVYPEVKSYAVALVHSIEADGVDEGREVLKEVAAKTIEQHGLTETHRIAVGNDAIEIVPKGLSPLSDALEFFSAKENENLAENGLNKGTAVTNFMSLAHNYGRTPYFVGDSGTDGLGMNVCHDQFGGGGVWVNNGNDVPEKFRAAVQGRTMEDFSLSWNHLYALREHLEGKATIYRGGATDVGIQGQSAAQPQVYAFKG